MSRFIRWKIPGSGNLPQESSCLGRQFENTVSMKKLYMLIQAGIGGTVPYWPWRKLKSQLVSSKPRRLNLFAATKIKPVRKTIVTDWSGAVIAAMLLIFGTVAGQGGSIPILNHSFESPSTGSYIDQQMDNWTGTTSGSYPFGVYHPNDYYNYTGLDGTQVAYLNGINSISQILTNVGLAASETYTLTGVLGSRINNPIQTSDIVYAALYAGTTLLVSNTIAHPAQGTFVPWTNTYTAPSSGFPSGNLKIVLGLNATGSGQANLDNIVLTSSGSITTTTLSSDRTTTNYGASVV